MAAAATSASSALHYGCLVNLYKQSLDGYVVATSSAEAPVGVQSDTPDFPLRYEQTIFQLQPCDSLDVSSNQSGGDSVVKYGHTIRLLHYAHQQPLVYHTERHATGLKGNLRVLLEKKGKSKFKIERWRIMPRYRLRVEGEPVVDGDPVVLQAVDGERYLNVALQVDDEAADSFFLEVSVGTGVQGFMMSLYDGDAPVQNMAPSLRCGDSITLLHTEEHKYVLADLAKKMCLLRTPDSCAPQEEEISAMGGGSNAYNGGSGDGGGHSSDNEQAVAWYAASKEEVSYLSVFVIEAVDPRKGGLLHIRGARDFYRLKSLASGLYLQCGEVPVKAPPPDPYLASNSTNNSMAPFSPTFSSGATGSGTNLDGDGGLNDVAMLMSAFAGGNSAASPEDVMSPTISTASRQGGGHAPPQPTYALSLTANPKAPGTVFQLHCASSATEDNLPNGGRVFLSCMNSKKKNVWLVAGGPAAAEGEDNEESELTVASLAHRSKAQGNVHLFGKSVRSMRDGMEVRRLQPKALEELYMIRGLLPPLQRYVRDMARGVGNAYQVRQVRENIRQLQQLCHRSPNAADDEGTDELMNLCNIGAGVLNPDWQGKVFQQGVGELALEVVKATMACPFVNPEKLGSLDMVYPIFSTTFGAGATSKNGDGGKLGASKMTTDLHPNKSLPLTLDGDCNAGSAVKEAKDGEGKNEDEKNTRDAYSSSPTAAAGAAAIAAAERANKDGNANAGNKLPGSPAPARPTIATSTSALAVARKNSTFLPMRYSELGDLVYACFQLVRLLLYNRPRYAVALQGYADFVMECTQYIPCALKCLAAFYKDNPIYVELPMGRHRLDFFLDMLKKRGRDPDVLRILQLFASCGGEGMVEAQRIILDFFTKDADTAQQLLCPVRRMQVDGDVREALLQQVSEKKPSSSDKRKKPSEFGKNKNPSLVLKEGGDVPGMEEPTHTATANKDMPVANPLRTTELPRTAKYIPITEGAKSMVAAADKEASSPLREGREVVMVGIPNSIFADPESGDSVSVSTASQFRAKSSKLGELLQEAADASDAEALTYFPLEGFLAVMQDWPEIKDTLIPYLVAQIRLFAALAHGKGKSSSKPFIFEWIPKLVLTGSMEGEAIPRQLHAAFLELFSNVMMDVDGAHNIREQIQNIRCVVSNMSNTDDSERNASSVAMSFKMTMDKVPNELAMAKRAVVRYMRRTMVSGDEEVVEEYLSILNLTDALVNVGAFELTEYDILVRLMIQTIDPLCDDHRTYLEVQAVYDCKSRALRLMNVLTDVLLVQEALGLVDTFRNGQKPATYSQITALNITSTLQNMGKGKPLHRIAEEEEQDTDSDEEHEVFIEVHAASDREVLSVYGKEDRKARMELLPVAEMFRALLDLANHSRSSMLQRQVICFFFRITNFLDELYATAMRVQLLTSQESIGFYSDINRTAVDLDRIMRKSFKRSNTVVLANSALDALDGFLSTARYGAAAEKLAMMHHVGVPLQLVHMLTRLPVPLRESTRQLVFKTVTLLQTMSQNQHVRSDLREAIVEAAPLVYQNTNFISLLRTLYVAEDGDRAHMSSAMLADVVRCLYTPHSTTTTIDFLCDWLTAKGTSGHVTAHRQQQVWRAIVSDQQAERRIQLRHTWCSDKGRELRERYLTSDDCFALTGRVATHLEMCHMLYLVANKNEYVKPEEIRQELFGQNSVDSLLQVTTDPSLPVYFRSPYAALLQALVLDDTLAVSSLFAHRDFPDFVHMCMMDAVRYLQLLGGSCVFPEVDEELERREDAALRCQPNNDTEQEVDDARFGRATYEDFFFGPLCTCMQSICACYKNSISLLSNRLRTQLAVVINEAVDSVCDVLEHVFPPQGNKTESLASPASDRTNATKSPAAKVPFPEESWRPEQLTALRNCLRTAKENSFQGTARWRGSAFTKLYTRLDTMVEQSAKAAQKLTAATQEQKTVSTVAKGVPMKTESDSAAASPASRSGDHAESEEEEAVMETGNALTNKWISYLHDTLLCDPRMLEENWLISAAGILLRSGARGTMFSCMLFTVMPSLQRTFLVNVLTLVRQLVVLMPGNEYDDSALLPLHVMDSNTPFISLTTPVPSRQGFLSRWTGDPTLEVPLPLIAIVGEFVGYGKDDVRRAALLAGCTLLMKSHRGMQESYYNYCRRSAGEQLFFILRNHLTEFENELRTYYHAVSNGSTPQDAEHYLTQMANCTLELRLLQLMCAGQYSPLQTYLVEQKDNNISVNVVEALVGLLSLAPKVASEVTSDFLVQLLCMIGESLQGPCLINQDTFVGYNAADYLTQLLSEIDPSPNPNAVLSSTETVVHRVHWHEARFGSKAKKQKIQNAERTAEQEEERKRCRHLMQTIALSTLLALIEGRDDAKFARKLIASVDLTVLARSMDFSAASYEAHHGPIRRRRTRGLLQGDFSGCWAVLRRYFRDYLHGDHPTGREELQDELALAVSIYTFFRACHDMHTLATTRSRKSGGTHTKLNLSHEVDEFLDKRGQSIRQVLRRSKSYKAVATKLAKVEVVRDGRLERVYFRVLSSTLENLLRYRKTRLIGGAVRSSDNERIQYFFNKSSDVIIEVEWYTGLRHFIVLYLLFFFNSELSLLEAVVVLAINLVMIAGIRAPVSPYVDGTSPSINHALYGLGIVNICVQGVILIQSFFGPALVSYKVGWHQRQLDKRSSMTQAESNDIATDKVELLQRGQEVLKPSWYEWVAYSLYFIFTDLLFLPQAFFFFVSVMGYAQHRIWYALLLMLMFLGHPMLEKLFTALASSFSSLVLTFALVLTFVVFFANISYYKFSDLFNPLGARNNGFNCYTMSQCFLVHVDTLRSGGGIGDVEDWPVYYSADGFGYWTEFFRMSYYVIVNLVGLNLFLGVIIDSLAQYRQQHQFEQTDQVKKCFICGIERNIFDQVQPGAYESHIREEHNMWQYLFFLHYLSQKDPESYTGQEAYLTQEVLFRDVTFFPIGKSLVLNALEGGDSATNMNGVDSGAGSGGGDGASDAAGDADEDNGPDEATAKLVAKLVETALKNNLDPLKRKIEETAEGVTKMKERLMPATAAPAEHVDSNESGDSAAEPRRPS